MADASLELLKELTEASGIPGYEQEIYSIIRGHLEDFTTIEQDRLGSIVCIKKGSAESPRIMLAGHMDEIGFIVKYVNDNGFIKLSPMGGWWDQVLLAQRMVIKTRNGDVPGVIGAKPPHILPSDERGKVVKLKDMYLDVGATNGDQVKDEFGVQPGDPVIPESRFTVLANSKRYLTKALDDRFGCALFIDALKSLRDASHPNTVYGVGTVQEEVGLRGARTSSWIAEPDVAFAFDTSIAGDLPGIKKDEAQSKLGEGAVILIRDGSLVPNLGLRDFVVDVAKELEIPLQYDLIEAGGTDAGAMHLHKAGVPSLVMGIGVRHIHSHAGIMDRDDYDNVLKLIVEVIKRLDAGTVAKFQRCV